MHNIFGYDEKNTIRAIHISRKISIKNFSTHILVTRHTSTYLPTNPTTSLIWQYHNIKNDYFNWAFAAGKSHLSQYFLFQFFCHYSAAYFSICIPHFYTISVIRLIWTTIRSRHILPYFTYNPLPPSFSKKINTWCADSPKLKFLWTIY